MPYLTYGEYTLFGGSLDEKSFAVLEAKAGKTIDYYTQNRLAAIDDSGVSDTVKHLMYDLIQISETTGSQNISSASNDGVSITYAGNTEIRAKNEELIRFYLSGETTGDGTPLLYAGVV